MDGDSEADGWKGWLALAGYPAAPVERRTAPAADNNRSGFGFVGGVGKPAGEPESEGHVSAALYL